jgi:hypothetical protein
MIEYVCRQFDNVAGWIVQMGLAFSAAAAVTDVLP